MLNYILLLFMSLSPAATIYVDDGCEAKSQWGIEYKWTSVNISAWIPYEEDTQILTIEIELEDLKHPVNYDNLNVYKKEIKFEEIREGEPKSEGNPITNQKPGHWANFEFTMDTHYGFMSLSTLNEVLFRKEIENNPTKLTIKGSNVTVYCHDNSRMWNVGEDKSAVIPLENEKVSSFILYSTKEFTGELELEKRKFSLGWQDGALTTIPEAEAIPQFEQHHVELHCREEGKVKCDIKVGENRDTVEKDILMSAMPKTMTVKSEIGRFFVIKKGVSHEESSKTAPETMPSEDTIFQNAVQYLAIACFVLTTALLIMVAAVSIYLNIYKRRLEAKKNTEIEERQPCIKENGNGYAGNGYLTVESETPAAEAEMVPRISDSETNLELRDWRR